MKKQWFKRSIMALILGSSLLQPVHAQTPPAAYEAQSYSGLHAAAYSGNTSQVQQLIQAGSKLEQKDSNGRTPLHVAAFQSHEAVVKQLVEAGADVNALDADRYDIITIAAVANDLPMLRLAIELGGDPSNVTSPYDGTALIAAAHLGHVEVVEMLINAKAPLDHINNLGWTALIEAVILGDGGIRHTKVVQLLVEAGADANIADRQGVTPLAQARERGYAEMIRLLEPVTN